MLARRFTSCSEVQKRCSLFHKKAFSSEAVIVKAKVCVQCVKHAERNFPKIADDITGAGCGLSFVCLPSAAPRPYADARSVTKSWGKQLPGGPAEVAHSSQPVQPPFFTSSASGKIGAFHRFSVCVTKLYAPAVTIGE